MDFMTSNGSKYNGGHEEAPKGHRMEGIAAESAAGRVRSVMVDDAGAGKNYVYFDISK
jgi:hypothetical protein